MLLLHPTSRCAAVIGKFLIGLILLIGSPLFATLTIVADGSSSFNDSDFFSVSYDGTSSVGLTSLVFNLRAGSDGNAVFDSRNYYGSVGYSDKTFGGNVSWNSVYANSGTAGFYFDAGQFTGGDSIHLNYDTDSLSGGGTYGASSDSGGAFGAKDVSVTATFDDGTTVTGTFVQDSAYRSTLVLNVPSGTYVTDFSIDDIVSNRGERIPLNIDTSNNQNTSDYYISGLPDSVSLSEGQEVGNGSWIVSATDIGIVELIPTQIYTGQFMLTIWQDTNNGISGGSNGTFGSGGSSRESLASAHTEFTYDTSGSVSDDNFIVTNHSQNGTSSWNALQDRSHPGNGMFLVANAQQQNKVLFKDNLSSLTPNTTYHISAFAANVHASETAELSFRVNGTEIFSTGSMASSSGWQEFGGSYTTGTNTSASFQIVSMGQGAPALDDVLFSASFEDDALITIHDAAYSDDPLYYNFTFNNSNSVSMTVNFTDTLPSGLTWDQSYEPIVQGLTLPTPVYSADNTTITINGIELPPGSTELSIRTESTTAIGNYTNEAQVTVADEDFLPQTFTASASFTVVSGG